MACRRDGDGVATGQDPPGDDRGRGERGLQETRVADVVRGRRGAEDLLRLLRRQGGRFLAAYDRVSARRSSRVVGLQADDEARGRSDPRRDGRVARPAGGLTGGSQVRDRRGAGGGTGGARFAATPRCAEYAELVEAGRSESSTELPGMTSVAIIGGVHELLYSEILHGATARLPARLPDIVYWITQPVWARRADRRERASASGRPPAGPVRATSDFGGGRLGADVGDQRREEDVRKPGRQLLGSAGDDLVEDDRLEPPTAVSSRLRSVGSSSRRTPVTRRSAERTAPALAVATLGLRLEPPGHRRGHPRRLRLRGAASRQAGIARPILCGHGPVRREPRSRRTPTRARRRRQARLLAREELVEPRPGDLCAVDAVEDVTSRIPVSATSRAVAHRSALRRDRPSSPRARSALTQDRRPAHRRGAAASSM